MALGVWGSLVCFLEGCVASLALVDDGGVGVACGFGYGGGFLAVTCDFAGVMCI